jgi:site-specific DNA-cytosine methylase
MGRAAIEDLREQGAHAWAHHEYGDERNLLMHKYVLFLRALRPDAFLFENVPQFTTTLRTPAGTLDAADVLAEAISELSGHNLDYEVTSEIINARRHAVPQDRARFFMVGFNAATTPAPALCETFFPLPEQAGEVPLATAFSGLETPAVFSPSKEPTAGTAKKVAAYTLIDGRMPPQQRTFLNWIRQSSPIAKHPPTTVDAHVFRAPRADDLAFIKKFAPGHRWMDYKLKRTHTLEDLRALLATLIELPEADRPAVLGSRDKLEELASRVDENLLLRLMLESVESEIGSEHHLLLPGYLSKGDGRHGDWFERLKPDRPSKTVIAHIGKDTYAYVHPFENRPITIREAARIQSFPDWYCFGSVGVVDGYAMIGNAVPPLLAAELARRICSLDESLRLFPDDREDNATSLERQLPLSDSLERDLKTLGYERDQTPELVK